VEEVNAVARSIDGGLVTLDEHFERVPDLAVDRLDLTSAGTVSRACGRYMSEGDTRVERSIVTTPLTLLGDVFGTRGDGRIRSGGLLTLSPLLSDRPNLFGVVVIVGECKIDVRHVQFVPTSHRFGLEAVTLDALADEVDAHSGSPDVGSVVDFTDDSFVLLHLVHDTHLIV
jgi:hypothetical protein